MRVNDAANVVDSTATSAGANRRKIMEQLITKMTVVPDGEPIFHERATHIEIDDEAAGEFLVISQCVDGEQKIRIDHDEWPHIRKAVNDMFKRCRG